MAEFQEIYTSYVRRVYRFLLALTGNSAEAEELTQQTFYQAFLHMGQFEGRSSLYTWLCQIGKNAWFRECHRLKRFSREKVDAIERSIDVDETRSTGEADTDSITAEGSMEEDLIRRDEGKRAAQMLCRLSQPHRDVVILRIYGELPFSEIAALFEKSESWGKVTFFRGKEKLRKMMEDQDDTV